MIITDKQRGLVVARARGQVGKGYRFGTAGPNFYDCSGSVLDAWLPVLALPHNSSEQVRWFADRANGQLLLRGTTNGQTNRTYLLPGDIVFYYGDPAHNPDTVSHDAVYVGKDAQGYRVVVNATNEERGVELIRLDAYARPTAFGLVGHHV